MSRESRNRRCGKSSKVHSFAKRVADKTGCGCSPPVLRYQFRCTPALDFFAYEQVTGFPRGIFKETILIYLR